MGRDGGGTSRSLVRFVGGTRGRSQAGSRVGVPSSRGAAAFTVLEDRARTPGTRPVPAQHAQMLSAVEDMVRRASRSAWPGRLHESPATSFRTLDQSHARNDFGSRVSFFAREGKSAFVQFSSTLVSERWWCGADGASRVRGRARGVDVRRRFQQRVGVLLYVASVSPRPSFFSFRWCFMFSLESLQSNAPSKPRLTRLPCVFPQPRRFS